jgi:hypothetical protein
MMAVATMIRMPGGVGARRAGAMMAVVNVIRAPAAIARG